METITKESTSVVGAAAWRGRSLVSLKSVTADEITTVLDTAAALKRTHREKLAVARPLYPRTLAMLFEKPSLRTRVSFEAGMAQLGGHAIYLAPGDVGLGTRETVPDVAAALSRWVDAISARVFKHETVEQLAENATIPVINALSDQEHPLQAFADLLTIREHKGALGNGLKLTYLGDGNNVLHTLLIACATMGIHISAACPAGYEPDPAYLAEANRIARSEGGSGSVIEILTDPALAVEGADVLYTDVWASMGQEAERDARAKVFAPYRIDMALVRKAKPDAIVLHCLPAHREEEITTEVMEAFKIPIIDEAENRLHTQKALLSLMLGL